MQATLVFPEARYAAAHGASWAYMFHSAPSRCLWAAVAVAALCGARRTTSAGALLAIVADSTDFLRLDDYAGGTAAVPILLGLVTVVAVLAGPGVARGRELLGRTGLIGIVALLTAVEPLDSTMVRHELDINWGARCMGLPVSALLGAAWLARGAAGRRAVVVLAAPLFAVVSPSYPAYIDDPLTRFMVAVPAAVGLAALAAVTVLEWLMIRPVAPRRSEPGG